MGMSRFPGAVLFNLVIEFRFRYLGVVEGHSFPYLAAEDDDKFRRKFMIMHLEFR